MTRSHSDHEDPFDLARFVSAQQDVFDRALREVKSGQKASHWMWYMFPQLRGLGHSPIAQRFGITGIEEAKAYLEHEILGPRLITLCEAALSVKGRSATELFGAPDDLKFRSCATLFAQLSPVDSVFHKILDQYFAGIPDQRTLQLLIDS